MYYRAAFDAGSPTLWSSFRAMERVLEQVAQRVDGDDGTGQWPHSATPAVDIWGDDHRVVLTYDLPGVDPAAITVTVLGDTVTIRGERPTPGITEPPSSTNQSAASTEVAPGIAFSRSIHLPYPVDADRTEATAKAGVLTLVLHRPTAEQPRRIPITAA